MKKIKKIAVLLLITFLLNLTFSIVFTSTEKNKIDLNLSNGKGTIDNISINFLNRNFTTYYIDSPFSINNYVLKIKNNNGVNLTIEDENNNILPFCFKFNESCGYCPKPWIEYKGHCYLIPKDNNGNLLSYNWLDSLNYCSQKGAYLVVINNDNEAKFLVDLINKTTSLNTGNKFWVGLFQGYDSAKPNSNWIWLKKSSWFKWLYGEPDDTGGIENNDENCGAIYSNIPAWELSDEDCSDTYYFICERRPFYSNISYVKVNLTKSFFVKEGKSVLFNASKKSYMQINLTELANKQFFNLTISFWFKRSDLSNNTEYLLTLESWSNAIFIDNNYLKVNIRSNITTYNSAKTYLITKLNNTSWNYFVITFNRGNLSFYLNGKLVKIIKNNLTYVPFYNYLTKIGSQYNNYYFNGNIDEIRIINNAWNHKKVLNCYFEGKCDDNKTLYYFSFDKNNPLLTYNNVSFDFGIKYKKVNKIYLYNGFFNAKTGFEVFPFYNDFKLNFSGSLANNAYLDLKNQKLVLTKNLNGQIGYLYWILKNNSLLENFEAELIFKAYGGSGADAIWLGVFDKNYSGTSEDIVNNGYHFTFDEYQNRICFTNSTKGNGKGILCSSEYTIDNGSKHLGKIIFNKGNVLIYYDNNLKINTSDKNYLDYSKNFGNYLIVGGRTGALTNYHELFYFQLMPYFSEIKLFNSTQDFKLKLRPNSISLKKSSSQFIQTKNNTYLFGNITLNITEIKIPFNYSDCDYWIRRWCFKRTNISLIETKGDESNNEGNEFIDIVPFDYNKDNLIDFLQIDYDSYPNYDDFMVWINNRTNLIAKNLMFNFPSGYEPDSYSKLRVKNPFYYLFYTQSFTSKLYLNFFNRLDLSKYGYRYLDNIDENSGFLNILDNSLIIEAWKEEIGTNYNYSEVLGLVNYSNFNENNKLELKIIENSKKLNIINKLSSVGHFSDNVNYITIFYIEDWASVLMNEYYIKDINNVSLTRSLIHLFDNVNNNDFLTIYDGINYLKTAFPFDLDLDGYDELLFVYYNASDKKYYLNYYDFQNDKIYQINTIDKIVGFNASKIIPVDYNNDGLLDLLFVRNHINDYILLLNQGADGTINTFYAHWPNNVRFPYYFLANNTYFYTFTFNNSIHQYLIENSYSKNNYLPWFNETAFLPIFNCSYYDFYYECKLKGLRLNSNYFVLVGNLSNHKFNSPAFKPIRFFYPLPLGNYCEKLLKNNITFSSKYYSCSYYLNKFITKNLANYWLFTLFNGTILSSNFIFKGIKNIKNNN
ncbi:MAG: LamG-like jellyroll fold domain-containing protein [Nanoarchaeota archaeon]